MKNVRIALLSILAAGFALLGMSKALANIDLPRVTTVCETRSGRLFAFNDGFSFHEECEGKERRVVLIGEQSLTIEQVEQLIAAAIGSIQEQINGIGEEISVLEGQIADTFNRQNQAEQKLSELEGEITTLKDQIQESEEIEVFSFQQLTHGQESLIIDTRDYEQLVLDGDSQSGGGGFNIMYSNDQSSWTIQGGITVGSGTYVEHVQRSFPIKGDYYKVVVVNSFMGSSSIVLY